MSYGAPRPPLPRAAAVATDPGPSILGRPTNQGAPPMSAASIDQTNGEIIEPMHVPATPGSDPRYSGPRDGKDITLIGKMAEAGADMADVVKNGYNDDQNFTFATGDDVKRVVRGPLLARRVMMLIGEVGRQTRTVPKSNGHGTNRFVDLLVRFTFMDGDSGEIYTFHLVGSGNDVGGKGNQIAMSNAVKTALTNQFLLPLEESDTPTADGERPQRAARTPSGGPRKRTGTLPYGRSKGKLPSEAPLDDLKWMRKNLEGKLDGEFGANNRKLIDAIDAEIAERGEAQAQEPEA